MGKKNRQGFKPMAAGTSSDATNQQDLSMIENEESVGDESADGGDEAQEQAATAPSVEGDAVGDESPVAGEVDAPVQTDAPAELPSYQQSSLEEGLLTGFKHRLEEYCQLMGRSVPITAAKGSVHQHNLYRLFLDILRQDGSLFTKAWSDLLAGVHDQRNGAFDTLYANRFINEVKPLSKTELRVFMNLMHLVRITADRKSRAQMLKTVDFTSVTANIPVTGAFEKLHGFYFSA